MRNERRFEGHVQPPGECKVANHTIISVEALKLKRHYFFIAGNCLMRKSATQCVNLKAIVKTVAHGDRYLGKKSVEAMHFLLLLHKCVILSNALQCELFHQVDFIRVIEMFFLHQRPRNIPSQWSSTHYLSIKIVLKIKIKNYTVHVHDVA